MHNCILQPMLIFYGVISAVKSFHLPNLDLTSNVDIDSSKHNTGLIHSYLQSNWSQSLNIGSVSVAATLIIVFVCVVMHIRTQERITQLAKHVQNNQRNISRITLSKRKSKPHPTLYAEEEV